MSRRADVVAVARRLIPLGLTQGTSGNVSVRAGSAEGVPGDAMFITPSALPYDAMEAEDVVLVDLAHVDAVPETPGGATDGTGRRPSTEWRMHAGILKGRPDVSAIVHAHPPWATALSCLRRDIPAFHYMVAIAGGRLIRCAAYATFGTSELAKAALEALGDRRACLLANHGIIACGDTAEAALELAIEVEALAGQYMRALSAGEPELLSDEEMDRVLESFADYRRARAVVSNGMN